MNTSLLVEPVEEIQVVATQTITYREAVREAIREAMRRDERVFLMGEDVGLYGGCFAVTKGLLAEFGPERIRDTPMSESGFTGAGIGAALGGMRPIVEVMTCNFSLLAADQIVNNAATLLHMSGGQFNVPLVIRMSTGGGKQLAAQHSHSWEGWYAHVPGLKVLVPATVEDARGMLWPALQDPDPVLIFENSLLYAEWVVNAAGPWAQEVGAMAGVPVPVQPDCHEAGITEPVTPFLRPMVVDIRPGDSSANFYFYQHQTGQVLFCLTPSPPILGTDLRETSAFLPQVARRMVDLMPRLKNLRVRRTWRGLYPMTPDGAPLVGEVESAAGFINAVGMCGQGFMLGPGLALYLRRLITGTINEETRAILNQLSPQRSFKQAEKLK